MMGKKFCSKILKIYPDKTDCVDVCSDSKIYVYDSKEEDRTIFMSAKSNDCGDNRFKIINNDNKEIIHICVDGVLIKKGEAYDEKEEFKGRFDCMVFDEDKLLLIELKLNTVSDNQKTLAGRIREGITQIKEYYCYLERRFGDENDSVKNYFKEEYIISMIVVNSKIKENFRWTTQLNASRERFRQKTGSKIDLYCEYEF